MRIKIHWKKIHWIRINERLYIAKDKINELEDIAIETIVDI